jgi:NADPH:quinone reductase-like Zn-dependent oxidoreductase
MLRPLTIDRARANGQAATVVLDGDGLAERVAASTREAQPKLGIDAVGGDASLRLAGCLGPGAMLAVHGMLSGESIKLAAPDLLFRGVTVKGFFLKHWFERTAPARIAEVMRKFARRCVPFAPLVERAASS